MTQLTYVKVLIFFHTNASSGTWEILKIRGEGGMEVGIVSRKFEGEDFGSIPTK